MSVAASWLGSLLLFPVLPLQQWINARVASLWRLAFARDGLTGRWVSVYSMTNTQDKMRYEKTRVMQLVGGDIRGRIIDNTTHSRYQFVGRRIANDIIAHYWFNDESNDIGTIRLTIDHYNKRADGLLTVQDSAQRRIRNIRYSLRRLNPMWKIFARAEVRSSPIHERGVFALKMFKEGGKIGVIKFGREKEQGSHTLAVDGHHYDTQKPFRFLNHSCEPNAKINCKGGKKRVEVIALRDIVPQDEITINYHTLQEHISQYIGKCSCPKCKPNADDLGDEYAH
jgi:SET domain.